VSGTEESPAVGDEVVARPARKRRWIAWAAAAFGLVVAVALILPDYYSRYPALRVRMDNWRKSTHANFSCADCHMDPGPVGFLSFAAKSVPDFYSQLVQGPRSTNLLSVPDRDACQKCHTNYRQVSPQGDLLIPHRAHVVQLKMNCADCHKNLVHSANDRGFNSPEMSTCLRCHDGKTATEACVKCHTGKKAPPSHQRPDWLQVHSEKIKTVDCGKCHGFTQNFCADCHSRRPASHAGNWKTAHAAPATENRKRCLVCHDETFCKKCH
jgi:hypothetical protein